MKFGQYLVLGVICVLCGCSNRTDSNSNPFSEFWPPSIIPPTPTCQDGTVVFKTTIQELRIDGQVRVVEKDGAGIGAGIGAVGAGLATVATGGAAPVLMAVGGGAVGGYAGKEAGTKTVTSKGPAKCSLRVMYQGLPLVWSGDSDDWEDSGVSFNKCVMFHPGDPIEVVVATSCGHKWVMRYRWRSGAANGPLY